MLPKKQLTFAAFMVLASRVARTRAQAYKSDIEDGGYFTPYFPTDAYDGPSQQSTTTIDDEEQPSPTQPPAPESTEYSDGDNVTSEITTSGWTNSRVKPTSPPDNKKYTPVTETLSDGSSYQKGSFNKTLRWQSTGVLQHGGCPVDALIGDCYSMYLDSEGMLEPMDDKTTARRLGKRTHARQIITRAEHEDPYDPILGVDSPHEYFRNLAVNVAKSGTFDDMSKDPDLMHWKAMASSSKPPCKAKSGAKDPNAEPPAPRQRLEFLSWPPAPAGETWDYTWRTYVDERTTTTNRWWHMMQLLQRSGCGGYVTAQTAIRKSVIVKDKNRECPNDNCDSYDYALYKGKTILHHIRVRYGEDGLFGYKVKDLNLGRTILEYNAVGDMGSSSSVKFGIYRQAVEGMSEARMYVGDYVAEKVA